MFEWSGIKTKTAPASEPVTAADMRAWLRLSDTSQDAVLVALSGAARGAVEAELNRTILTTTYELFFDEFPETIHLPRPPVQSVTSIVYVDSAGTTQTLAASEYQVDSGTSVGRIVPAYGKSWPSVQTRLNAVTVTYKAGYGDNAVSVPETILAAIKAIAADLYEHPEAQAEIVLSENRTVRYLINSHRLVVLA